MKKMLITGATGMIGGIVLQQGLESKEVKQIISISRKSSGIKHPKLKEIIHEDFCNYSSIIDCFQSVDAAYFCLGVYTGAVTDEQFKKITIEFASAFADSLKEKSRMTFARYKGAAENYLLNKKFENINYR